MHTLTRENTGANIGHRVPIVHWDFVADWDGLDVKCVPKGSGSENMSFLKMCVPADGVAGVKRFVLESIVGAGGKPCAAGDRRRRHRRLRRLRDAPREGGDRAAGRLRRSEDPLVAELEQELIGLLNETGIGPMGLGGDVTVLHVHVEHADTHMTLNPVAVNYQCWAARRAGAHVSGRRRRRLRPGRVMAEHRLTFPTTEDEIRKLRAGDLVTVDGHIIGIRDRTQVRIFDQGSSRRGI